MAKCLSCELCHISYNDIGNVITIDYAIDLIN